MKSSGRSRGLWPLLTVIGCAASVVGCNDDDFGLPPLVASAPSDGATEVARTAWIDLRLGGPASEAAARRIALTCDDVPVRVTATVIGDGDRVVLDPAGQLPAGRRCAATWSERDDAGVRQRRLSFAVAAAGAPAPVSYDRDDASLLLPFPDAALLADDPGLPTGKRVAVPTLDRPKEVAGLLDALLEGVNGLDGFSPLAPFVIDLPAPLAPASLPASHEASLDPLATVQLIDVDPQSPRYRQRVPIEVSQRSGDSARGQPEHQLIVDFAVPLSPRGAYALVVTRRALVDATRPLGPSAFFARLLDPDAPRQTDAQRRVGAIADDLLEELRQQRPPLRAEDVALALRTRVRSMDGVADDRLAMRRLLATQPPPSYEITEVAPPDELGARGGVAAVVKGTWLAPQFRDGDLVARGDDGTPRLTDPIEIPFVLALPAAPAGRRAPVIIYQHGQPGSAEKEVPRVARAGLAAAGFAVIGFTDILNRENSSIVAIAQGLLMSVLVDQRFPDTIAVLPNGEQLAFLRLVKQLGSLDALPLGEPDGDPELDVDAPLGYFGISNGAHHGVGLLPFAPEIGAAALVVGGGKFASTLIHQEGSEIGVNVYAMVAMFYPDLTRGELFAGLSLIQSNIDRQEWLNVARHLYREPLPLAAPPAAADRRASVLLTAGLGDGYVPGHTSASAAHAMGIPQLQPAAAREPGLELVEGPVRGNIDAETSAAFFQFVPSGHPELPCTPGCEKRPEGHFCPQNATAPVAQRVRFFESALGSKAPEIIVP